MVNRKAGLRGKLEPKSFGLKYVHEYGLESDKGFPESLDVTRGITDWGMLGNGPDPTLTVHGGQPVGDCVVAGTVHNRMSKLSSYHEPTSDEVVQSYLDFTGGVDSGINMADWFKHLFDTGQIKGFAPVDFSSRMNLESAMAEFDGVLLGVQLPADADQQFEEGLPWTFDNSPTAGGHCVVLVKYDNTSSMDTVVTWGALQNAQVGWERVVDEAWVILTQEDLDRLGSKADALLADLRALPGSVSSTESIAIPPEVESFAFDLVIKELEAIAEHLIKVIEKLHQHKGKSI